MEIVQTKSSKLKFEDLVVGKIYTLINDYNGDYHGSTVEAVLSDTYCVDKKFIYIKEYKTQSKNSDYQNYRKLLGHEYCRNMTFVGEGKSEYTIKVDNKELDLLKAISKYYLNVFDYGGDQSVLAKKIRDYNAE